MTTHLTRGSNVLLSGATGLIGGEIFRRLADLVPAGRVWPVIRPAAGLTPADRLGERLARGGDAPIWGRNVRPLAGDIRLPDWGLEDAAAAEVVRDADIIVHNAADTSFVAHANTADTNVEGVRQLIALAGRCARRPLIVYMSTASNVGDIVGGCLTEEEGCRPDNRHHNEYTQSKAVGERLLRESGLPLLVLRPTIVLSADLPDARFARQILWCVPLLRIFRALPLNADARLDIADVGFVADATLRLMARPTRSADCYHLSSGPERARTLGTLLPIAEECYGRRTPMRLVPPAEWSRECLRRHVRTEMQRTVYRSLRHYFPFLNMDVTYDDARLRRELGADCPPVRAVEEYGPALLALIGTKAAYREAAVP